MTYPKPRLAHVLAVLLALTAGASRAQVPINGYDICDDGACANLVNNDAARSVVFSFKLAAGSLTAPADVLYDARNVGGVATGNATVAGAAGWQFSPNWRLNQSVVDDIVVVVNGPDWIYWDSGSVGTTSGSFGFCSFKQVPGALAGNLSPLVEVAAPTGARVKWTPIREVDTRTIGAGCERAGATDRGFVLGYDVYRLAVATYPDPTPGDFVRHGYRGFAELGKLSFNVPDSTGSSGSDLDASDSLTLINPDGQPDTGDEILVWLDPTGAPPAYWYRVQPVVRGDQGTPSIGGTSLTVQRLDLNGDGTLDSVDIGSDGMVEFIDPSGRGLGLTWAGDILSSPEPGRLGATPGTLPPCPVALERKCGNSIDDDRDGRTDCADTDCAADAACGGDTDGDTIPDGADNCDHFANPAQADADGDGLGDACEFAWGDIAPAGAYDGVVNVADVVRALRFSVTLEVPTADELKRGNVAPATEAATVATPTLAAPLVVNVQDVVLMLRASVHLVSMANPS